MTALFPRKTKNTFIGKPSLETAAIIQTAVRTHNLSQGAALHKHKVKSVEP